MMKVLLTSPSFQDVPGRHRNIVDRKDIIVDVMHGPLTEASFLPVIAQYDALLCGDDDVTAAVLQKGKEGKLKYISKYGVGVDKIDIAKAKELQIPVTICPGVNQHAVAELVFGLLLSFARNIHLEYEVTKNGGWGKRVGQEMFGKTMGVIGFGAIGKEVAKRATAFGMKVLINTAHPDAGDISQMGYTLMTSVAELASKADIISLNVPLTPKTEELINEELINTSLKRGVIIVNVARGKLVNVAAVKKGLEDKNMEAKIMKLKSDIVQ